MTSGRVLIVDDDRDVREMLAEYLASHGYTVAQADGGVAMRNELERAVPDVVLLDLALPGEDGLTLARYLRERYDLGIIMVTGAGELVDRIVGLEMGADDYIAKPFDPRELRARMKSVLRTHRPAIVDSTLENKQSLPFVFDPSINKSVFAVEGFDPGGIHLLLPLRLATPDGSTHVVYQDNLMRDVVHVTPSEFRLERDPTAPYLPALSFLASEFSTTDNDQDADVLFRVAAVYRLEPWLDPDVVELARAELLRQGHVARFMTSVSQDAKLLLDLDLLGTAQQRAEAEIDPDTGITDALDLDQDTFVRLWRERLANPSGGGVTGRVDFRLFDGSPAQVPVRLSLWETSAELFDVSFVGPVPEQPACYRVLVRNRVESPAWITGLPPEVLAGGGVAYAVDAQSVIGQIVQPKETRPIDYCVQGATATVAGFEPTVIGRPEPNLAELLKQLMLTAGGGTLGFGLTVKAVQGAFDAPANAGEPLTGLLVEFDDGTRVTLSAAAPQAEVTLAGRLLDQILGTADDNQRYFYRVTNVHARGEGAHRLARGAGHDSARGRHGGRAPGFLMLVLTRAGDALLDDVDPAIRYRLPIGLEPVPGPNGVPQAVLTRSDDSGLFHLRLGTVWPELAAGERPVFFAAGRFRLLLQTPATRETGQWHPTPIAGDIVVDRSISLAATEVAIARRLGDGTGGLVDVEVELEVRGFGPTFPWLASARRDQLKPLVEALLGSGPAGWEAVEAAFLGLDEDAFAWHPLVPGAIRPPRDAALKAIAHHAAPLLLVASGNGWTVANDGSARLDLNLAGPIVQTQAVGLRWSFSEFLSRAGDRSRHLVDVSVPAPFAAAELCVVNDVPLAVDGVRSIVVEVRTGGPTGLLSHEFRPGEPAAARLRFVRETAEALDIQWRARATVVTSSGPTALPPTDFRKSGLMIEVTPAALGVRPLRFFAAAAVFDHAAAVHFALGSRTLTLTRSAPEAWAVGREPPASATVVAELPSAERKSPGPMPIGRLGLSLDVTALGIGELAPVIIRPPDDLAARAAYLAVQVEGHGWRTVEAGRELTLPVRLANRLQPPRIRYRTRHVPRREGGATSVMTESAWREAASEIVAVEL